MNHESYLEVLNSYLMIRKEFPEDMMRPKKNEWELDKRESWEFGENSRYREEKHLEVSEILLGNLVWLEFRLQRYG